MRIFMGSEDYDDAIINELPMGYRFQPSDEELVWYYLENKVYFRPLPAKVITEIDSMEFFSQHPRDLESISRERETVMSYFFIHDDDYFHGEIKKKRTVGDGIGYWSCTTKEEPIFDANTGKVFAYKHLSRFFSTQHSCKPKKTIWHMEEYRLKTNTESCGKNDDDQEDLHIGEWVVAKIFRMENRYDNSV